MPQVNFRVGPDLHQRFQAMCEERGKTITDVLSEAMVAFVERDMAAKEPLPERGLMKALRPARSDVQWPPRSDYGERLKKDKGSKWLASPPSPSSSKPAKESRGPVTVKT